MNDEGIVDWYINLTEDERTAMAKGKDREAQHLNKPTMQPTKLEKGWGLGHLVATAASCLYTQLKKGIRQRMWFASSPDTQEYNEWQWLPR